MSIISNLPVLMAERKIKGITELMELSGLSRNAINRVYDDRDEKINATSLKTLIALCDSLNCSLSDLIEYVPEQKRVTANNRLSLFKFLYIQLALYPRYYLN